MDQLHKESNESHESKANCSGHRNLLELLPVMLVSVLSSCLEVCLSLPVRLGAPLDQSDGVLPELLDRLNRLSYLIHGSGY